MQRRKNKRNCDTVLTKYFIFTSVLRYFGCECSIDCDGITHYPHWFYTNATHAEPPTYMVLLFLLFSDMFVRLFFFAAASRREPPNNSHFHLLIKPFKKKCSKYTFVVDFYVHTFQLYRQPVRQQRRQYYVTCGHMREQRPYVMYLIHTGQ